MTEKPTAKPATPYINNPFMISIEGISGLFEKARGVATFLIIATVALLIFGMIPTPDTMTGPGQAELQLSTEQLLWILIPQIAFTIFAIVVSGVLGYASAKVARGETVTFNEAISGFMGRFWGYVWLEILMLLKILAWTLLLIVPGVIMSVRYSLAHIAFFDKNLSANEAIKHSAAITKGSWFTTFAAQTLLTMLSFGIISLLTVGGAAITLYRQFEATPLDERPRTHGLSIATFILSIVFLLLVLALAILFAVMASQVLGE